MRRFRLRGFSPLAKRREPGDRCCNAVTPHDPHAESRYGMTCDLGPQFQSVLGEPPDYSIYYFLAHNHEWGSYFRPSFVDDAGGDRTIFELENSIGEPLGITLDPPIPSLGAGRLRVD